jgi:hypothetical protein
LYWHDLNILPEPKQCVAKQQWHADLRSNQLALDHTQWPRRYPIFAAIWHLWATFNRSLNNRLDGAMCGGESVQPMLERHENGVQQLQRSYFFGTQSWGLLPDWVPHVSDIMI